LQEIESDVGKGEQNEVLSQGFDGGLYDLAHQFYGGNSNLNTTKTTRGLLGSQVDSRRQTIGSRFSSLQASKTSFGLNDGTIGDGGTSLKILIDSNRDLSSIPSNTLAN